MPNLFTADNKNMYGSTFGSYGVINMGQLFSTIYCFLTKKKKKRSTVTENYE